MNKFFSSTKPLLVVAILLMASCQNPKPSDEVVAESKGFKVGAWISVNAETDLEQLKSKFSKLSKAGFTEILINTGADSDLLAKVTPLAKASNLDVHAWMSTMNRPGDSVALEHPDWYSVSREGNSCYDHRPYVNYYQWLCPSRPEAVNHILELVDGLAKVPGVESVHLDYIRFVDVFLPIGLLPKYNLTQNAELPEYDFCYCEVCRSKFKESHHRDPLESEHPELDIEWRQFRLNAIRDVVNKAYQKVKTHDKKLTAAVFPYPTMAANMVRQRWDKWDVDRVYPMVYHHFYNENLDWIGFATQQGVADLVSTKTELSTGVFVPAIDPDEIPQVIKMVKVNGAVGICFFSAGSLSEAHLKKIKEGLLEIKD